MGGSQFREVARRVRKSLSRRSEMRELSSYGSERGRERPYSNPLRQEFLFRSRAAVRQPGVSQFRPISDSDNLRPHTLAKRSPP